LKAKKALVEQVVGAGEQWLTELDTDQLRNLLLLDRNAVIEEDQNDLYNPQSQEWWAQRWLDLLDSIASKAFRTSAIMLVRETSSVSVSRLKGLGSSARTRTVSSFPIP